MLAINLSKDAAKFLARVHPRHGRQIAVKLQQLRENPAPNGAQQIRGYPFMRADVGEYRIIFTFTLIFPPSSFLPHRSSSPDFFDNSGARPYTQAHGYSIH